MSNKLITRYNRDIPDNINAKLKELLEQPADKTIFTQEGNTIKIQKISKNGIINVEAKSYPDAQKISQINISKKDKKKDLKDTIQQMADDGYANKDIAEMLDMSPSYVSKLKNK